MENITTNFRVEKPTEMSTTQVTISVYSIVLSLFSLYGVDLIRIIAATSRTV